jgi:hypothetical protein
MNKNDSVQFTEDFEFEAMADDNPIGFRTIPKGTRARIDHVYNGYVSLSIADSVWQEEWGDNDQPLDVEIEVLELVNDKQ